MENILRLYDNIESDNYTQIIPLGAYYEDGDLVYPWKKIEVIGFRNLNREYSIKPFSFMLRIRIGNRGLRGKLILNKKFPPSPQIMNSGELCAENIDISDLENLPSSVERIMRFYNYDGGFHHTNKELIHDLIKGNDTWEL